MRIGDWSSDVCSSDLLTFFETVHENDAACGTALKRGERIVVEDVEASPIVLGTPALDVLLAAGVRAVQSTPLFSRSGRLWGILSTHWRDPRPAMERGLDRKSTRLNSSHLYAYCMASSA